MKKSRKNFKKSVISELFKRSDGCCEVCKLRITTDNHHIIEHSKGGTDEIHNLVSLCPNCHRVLPKYLSTKQQRNLYASSISKVAYHNIKPINHNFLVSGGSIFINCRTILSINNQKVLFIDTIPIPYKLKNSIPNRFMVNFIALEGFAENIMLINNQIFYKASKYQIIDKPNYFKLFSNEKTILEISQTDHNNIMFNFHIEHEGGLLVANNGRWKLPGVEMRYPSIKNFNTAFNLEYDKRRKCFTRTMIGSN